MFFVNASSRGKGEDPGAQSPSAVEPSIRDGSWEEWLGRIEERGELKILHINTSKKIKRPVSQRLMLGILKSDFERCRFSGWEYSSSLFNGFRMCRFFNGKNGLCREEFRIKIISKRKN